MDSANRNFKWSSFCMFLFLLKTFQSYCLFLTIRSLINEQIWTSFSRNVFHIKEKYLYQKGVHTWSWNPAGFCHIALVGSHLQFPRSLLWQGSYRVVALRDWVASFLRTDNPSSPVEFILDPFIKLLYQPNFFFPVFLPWMLLFSFCSYHFSSPLLLQENQRMQQKVDNMAKEVFELQETLLWKDKNIRVWDEWGIWCIAHWCGINQ